MRIYPQALTFSLKPQICSFYLVILLTTAKKSTEIPLTNRVRGPYCKLRTEFFPVDLWPKREARGP